MTLLQEKTKGNTKPELGYTITLKHLDWPKGLFFANWKGTIPDRIGKTDPDAFGWSRRGTVNRTKRKIKRALKRAKRREARAAKILSLSTRIEV
jgi:hypothetical protein